MSFCLFISVLIEAKGKFNGSERPPPLTAKALFVGLKKKFYAYQTIQNGIKPMFLIKVKNFCSEGKIL